MGAYIRCVAEEKSAADATKEFLDSHGVQMTKDNFLNYKFKRGERAVVTIDNGTLVVSKIMYDKRELKKFSDLITPECVIEVHIVPIAHLRQFLGNTIDEEIKEFSKT